MGSKSPYIINLKEHVAVSGSLSVLEKEIPFEIKRVYWLYNLKSDSSRGDHVHLNSDRVLVCLAGTVNLKLTSRQEKQYGFSLSSAKQAFFFPRNHWIELNASDGAVLLALVSCGYEEDITINDYNAFLAS